MTGQVSRRILVLALAGMVPVPPTLAQNASGRSAAPGPVLVFAAASLKNALDAIAREWTATTGKKVTFSYAASGSLARQIENGAPADLFASADLNWMGYAEEKKLIRPETRKQLLGNRLVLIAPKDAPVDIKIAKGFRLAEAIGDGKLATGSPAAVPVGTYAKAALITLGVWDQVAPKIAGAESVRAALAFVARGEAKLGIVYETDAKSEPRVRVVDAFPADSHPPIVYPFAVTVGSRNAAAGEFLAFLGTPTAVRVFRAEGFTVLP